MLITGDYKFDQTPVDGPPADVSRLAELGREGVLLLCGDSTNVDRQGFSPSESVVGPHLEEVFARCEGRIVVTSFASNIHRVQQVVDAAYALDRKVALVGRSMRKNVGIGRTLGHIEIPDGHARRPARDRRLPRRAHRDHLDRLPGRAAVGAAPHGLPRPPPGRAARAATPSSSRPRRSPATSARSTRRSTASTTSAATWYAARRARARLGPRLRRGGQADAQPRQAALRDALPRRLQAAAPARPARRGGRRRAGGHLPGRQRPAAGHRRARRALRRRASRPA